MRIVVDVTPAVRRNAGLGRYAEELTRALLALGSGDEIRLFCAGPKGRTPAAPLDALSLRALRWSNKLWRLSVLLSSCVRVPMDSMLGDADIFQATDHLLPTLRRMRSVFTLHDVSYLIHPETHLRMNSGFLKLMMPVFLRRADAVICVSQHTKNDATRVYGLDESKAYVIPEGVDPRFRPMREPAALAEVRARHNLPERYILFVGTIEPRKNLASLWEAYRSLRSEGRTEKLVVVGKKGWRYQAIFARLRELGLEGEVFFPGFIPDDDLPAVFSAADVFVFPSLYEGFGLPPLEAMASGCPVICSNTSSMPEVCGEAAILVPPTDLAALTDALRRVLDDPSLRDDMRGKGQRRAAGFTWRRTAEKTLEVYRAVMEGARHRGA